MPRSAVRSCNDFHWAFIGEYQFSCKHAIHFASCAVSNPQPKRARRRFHRRQLQQLPLCSFSRCQGAEIKLDPAPARLGSEVAEWSSFLARPGWARPPADYQSVRAKTVLSVALSRSCIKCPDRWTNRQARLGHARQAGSLGERTRRPAWLGCDWWLVTGAATAHRIHYFNARTCWQRAAPPLNVDANVLGMRNWLLC